MGNSWFIPERVLRHEYVVAVEVPGDCPKCHASVGARRDDRRGHVGCVLCGWEILTRRPARETGGERYRRKGRSRQESAAMKRWPTRSHSSQSIYAGVP